MNTQDLRNALSDQERFAPAEKDILAALSRAQGPSGDPRRRAWATGLLAAAAVVAIVIGVANLADAPRSAPAGPSVATAVEVTTEVNTTPPTTTPVDLTAQSRQRQAELAAEAAAVSAERAAEAAAKGAQAALKICSRSASVSILTAGQVDDRKIAEAAGACARAFGARAGYRVAWVQSTLGAVQTLVTGRPAGGARTVVAVQIDGTFIQPGQPGEHENMLLLYFLDGGSPTGVDAPIDPINLSTLGAVHRI